MFDFCKYLLNKQWNFSSDAWGFVHALNLMCWLKTNKEEFVDLCSAISLKFEMAYKVSCVHVSIRFMSFVLIIFFHVCFLKWISSELECGECMPLIIISQHVKRMDPFCPKVDVMLDYRLWQGDLRVKVSTILHTCLSMSGRILGIIGQHPRISKTNQLHVDIFEFFFAKTMNILQIHINKLDWGKVLHFSFKLKLLHPELLVSSVYFLHIFQYHHFILVHKWHELSTLASFLSSFKQM